MSIRGQARGRPRGRGRGRGAKTMLWEWETYKPGPEVYNNLYRLHKAPPTITHVLPNECPIPNAHSKILNRRQTDDEFCRNYYTVSITHLPLSSTQGASTEDDEFREEIEEVDISRILKYVSQRELERFEHEEFKAEAEAEATVRRAEAEEVARRRLEKNARDSVTGRGSRMLSGLGLDPELRPRGRPRGRGKTRGRGRGGWSSSLAVGLSEGTENTLVPEDATDTESLEAFHREDEELQRIIAETEDEEEETEDELLAKQPSPDLVRSSFVANSALPISPLANVRTIPKSLHFPREAPSDDESEQEDDAMSLSSAAAQLQFERESHERHISESEDESEAEDRHRTKRRRTESLSSSRPNPLSRTAPTSKQLHQLAHSISKRFAAEISESSASTSSEDISEEEVIPMQRPLHNPYAKSIKSNGAHASQRLGQAPIEDDDNDNDDDDDDDEEEDSDAEEYVIEAILNHSYDDGKKYYLVKWEGYEDSTDWLPEEDLAGAAELVATYDERVKKKKGKKPIF